MSYTVFIPTAGTGSRLGTATQFLNKSLIEINNKPIISHIIGNFDENARFVIPIGHKGDEVKDYLKFAHPELNIITVPINPFEGPGSSLGTTLKISQDYLQEPFIFSSCDTITNKINFKLDCNWLGWDEVSDNSSYRTLNIEQKFVVNINEKLVSNSTSAYIGLAGIKDHKIFWQNFNNKDTKLQSTGEVAAFNLENMDFKAIKFNWFDTGNPSQLSKARNKFRNNQISILPKEQEKIWFTNDKVIKFSTNKEFIKNRVTKSKILEDFVPKVIDSSNNMYVYKYAKGKVLSEQITNSIFIDLQFELDKLWKIESLSNNKLDEFYQICSEFYKDKTYERVNKYIDRYPEDSKDFKINEISCSPIYELLEAVEWENLINGIPSRIHGDLHFENIIYNEESKEFTFLDWRQDFGGKIEYGDIYYDFAKLLHGIIVPHPTISNGDYSITESEQNKNIKIFRSENIKNIEGSFKNWVTKKGYNIKKIELLCSLVFLNIATLHHHPYSKFLFTLGHWGLQNVNYQESVNWSSIDSI
jgi:NDP-sugar pyrophosphorylase family protein